MSMSVSVAFMGADSRQHTLSVVTTPRTEVGDLLKLINQDLSTSSSDLISSGFFALCNGRRMDVSACVEEGKIYHIVPRLPGGKGGFGSMLRAIGAQIEKTTSREACRDLSGRRMRDINNEKKLKEWLAKEADREKEREDKRADRLARRLNPPQHKFEDSQYHEQREKVQEDLEDALQTGLKRALKKSEGGPSSGPSQAKKAKTQSSRKEWLGVDLDSDEDVSSDNDMEADPGSEEMAGGSRPGPSSDGEGSSHSSHPDSLAGSAVPSSGPSDGENSQPLTSVQEVKTEPGSEGSKPVTDKAQTVDQAKDVESADTADVKPKSGLLTSLPPPVKSENAEVKEECEDTTKDIPAGPINLEDFPSESSLCVLGLDRLKTELMSRGLKCGGTVEERASRLFSVKGLEPDQYPASAVAKAKGKGKKSK